MNSKEAIKRLVRAGYERVKIASNHQMLRKGENVIYISLARTELSSGMTKKVFSYENR